MNGITTPVNGEGEQMPFLRHSSFAGKGWGWGASISVYQKTPDMSGDVTFGQIAHLNKRICYVQ
ncbi:MAG: hypothetical protein BroJett018_29580 [Chloroflexota bacterium]|nr:MAG: hypothetical protein BroJett018_29580 [Chloroflexota bacterium]